MEQKPIYHVSSCGYCAKALSFRRLGISGKEKPELVSTAAEEGNLHETAIKAKLISDGYRVFAEQQVFFKKTELFDLIGHIDGKVMPPELPESTMLLECKSMSEFEYNRWLRGNFHEFRTYAAQLSCYFQMTGLDKALYIVKNRNSGATVKPYPIISVNSPVLPAFDSIIAKLTHIETLALQNKCVEVEFDPSALECRRCDYINYCAPPFRASPQSAVILDAAVQEWRRGKDMEDQAKKIIDSAREILAEHCATTPQLKFFWNGLNIQSIHTKRETYEKKELEKLFTKEQLKPALKVTEATTLRVLDTQADKENQND